MAISLNKVILIGNVGKDPEIRTTQEGREVASFSVATSDVWKDKNSGEKREKTEWHRIVVFSPPLVSIIKNYVHRGTKLYIEGAIQTRKWTDQSGVEKYSTEVVLQNYNSVLMLLDSNNRLGSDSTEYSHDHALSRNPSHIPQKTSGQSYVADEIDDEIPF